MRKPISSAIVGAATALLVAAGPGLETPSAHAAAGVPLSSAQRATVEQVSSYFNGISDLRGEFTQISPRGRVSSGLFYISRPGRLRFEYAPPNPLLIVADGTWLTIKNRSKNSADQYPLKATPLDLIIGDDVNLNERADIKSVEITENLATITLEDKLNLVPGQLVLTYDTKAEQLQQWMVIDAQGRRTTVSLNNLEPGISSDPKLFTVSIPRKSQSKTDR